MLVVLRTISHMTELTIPTRVRLYQRRLLVFELQHIGRVVSERLRHLRRAGLVRAERRGQSQLQQVPLLQQLPNKHTYINTGTGSAEDSRSCSRSLSSRSCQTNKHTHQHRYGERRGQSQLQQVPLLQQLPNKQTNTKHTHARTRTHTRTHVNTDTGSAAGSCCSSTSYNDVPRIDGHP